MSMTKKIEIDGKQVPFRASAAIPRIYRMKFHRDIYKDLSALEKSIGSGDEETSNLDLFSLEMFENIAFIMAKHADPAIPDTPENQKLLESGHYRTAVSDRKTADVKTASAGNADTEDAAATRSDVQSSDITDVLVEDAGRTEGGKQHA